MKIIDTSLISPEDPLSEWEKDQIYNGLDCCLTAEILPVIEAQLDNTTAATYAFSRELQGPVLEMRLRGVKVDLYRRQQVLDEMFDAAERIEQNLDAIVLDGLGLSSFNWRSNDDLKKLFYEVLEIPSIRKGGKATADRDALEKIGAYTIAEPLVAQILALKDLGKKIGVLRTAVDCDGRIRTSYNIAGTSTGRFSSSLSEFGTGGNLQNVEESLRSIFIADPGMKFCKLDAKSGESFCVGAKEWNLFHDGRFLDVCETGDPHTAVARICWPKLPWTGDISKDKHIAESPFYRHYTHRFMCKKLGHGCLTEDHEVLTRNGWVPISNKPDEIMIWDGANSYFSSVSGWADYHYSGVLHEYTGTSVSIKATYDHRIIYKKDRNSPIIWERQAWSGAGSLIPLGDGFIGGQEVVPARLIAAFMADGHQEKNWIAFHFHKERKFERLIELCLRYNVQYLIHGDKIRVKGNLPKRPGSFMLAWTKSCIEEFIDELKYWDGHISPTAVSISSKYKEDLVWYQTLGRLIGRGGNISGPWISGYGAKIYKLQQNGRTFARGEILLHEKEEVISARVLCPTVETGFFYIRREGKISITGNSNYGGKPPTLAQQSRLPIGVVRQFQPLYFRAFPAHEQWQEWVGVQLRRYGQLISLSGRKRQFWGRRNDDKVLREAIAYDPQCSLADLVNTGMLRVWRQQRAILMMQDHDATTWMYPEEIEDEIVPWLLENLIVPLELEGGRVLRIPYDAQVGFNKGKYHPQKNPDGLKDYNPSVSDKRKRQDGGSILDRIIK